MSLPQCIEGCPQHESIHKTRVRHKQRHSSDLLPHKTVQKTGSRAGPQKVQKSPEFEGVQVQGVQGVGGVFGLKTRKTRKTLRSCMARLLRSYIQDFVQEVPVGQMAQGTPLRCTPWCKGG